MSRRLGLYLRIGFLGFLCATVAGCAQRNRVRLQSGSLGFLNQQTVVNVAFDYEGLRVGTKKKSVSEQEHLAKRMAKAGEQAGGSGEMWRQEWVNNRTLKFEPKFLTLLNKQFEDAGKPLRFGPHPEADYTMNVKTTHLEPGWHGGVMASPALLTAEVTFVESRNPGASLATISAVNVIGMDPWGAAYDEAWRMQESYAKTGKMIGSLIRKKVK